MLIEVVYFLLTRKVAVASKGDNLHTGSEHQECHVEAYLVVAGTGRTVCYGMGTYLVGISCNGYGLKYALTAHTDGITVVAKHIAIYHIAKRLVVIFVSNVEGYILHCAKSIGVFLVSLELFGAKTTGIGTCSIHFVAIVGKFHHCV